MENFKKVLRPGAVKVWKHRGEGYAPLFLKVEYTDGRLSITGVEGPRENGDAWGSCGQCTDALTRLKDLAPEWDRAMVKLREARRSTNDEIDPTRLEVWHGDEYVNAGIR